MIHKRQGLVQVNCLIFRPHQHIPTEVYSNRSINICNIHVRSVVSVEKDAHSAQEGM